MMFGMSPRPDRLFDDSITAPNPVQSIIDGTDGHNNEAYCGQCRQKATLRCARCKVVKYCCAQHQKDHFPFHKKNCKSISKQRQLVEEKIPEIDGMPWGVREGVVPMIKMGDLLVRMGYEESDTIAHGNVYYREALKYYVMPIKFLRDGYHHTYSFMEDKILLMLMALGGDNDTLESWFSETDSLRSGWYTPVSGNNEEAHGLSLHGLVEDDKFFHFIYLFNSLKALAVHRQNLERIEAYKTASRRADPNAPMDDVSNNIQPYLGCDPGDSQKLSGNIAEAISAFAHHRNESHLIHLRDSIPFSKEHAPDLFRESERSSIPGPEMWMILQDCYFETPGVRNLLDEFFGDEQNG